MKPQCNLVEIGNKLNSSNEVEGQYMGLLRFMPQGWEEMLRIRKGLSSEQCDKMHMTGMLQKVIDAKRVEIAAVPFFGEWGEVDSAEDLGAYR